MERKDPFIQHNFSVEIDGMYWGSFQEVGGLSASNEIYEIKEGGVNYKSHKFVNRTSYGDITLKYGFLPATSLNLTGWFENTAVFTATDRYDGRITMMMGEDMDNTATWVFERAFPLKWDAPAFNGGSGALSIEQITLACEYIYYEG